MERSTDQRQRPVPVRVTGPILILRQPEPEGGRACKHPPMSSHHLTPVSACRPQCVGCGASSPVVDLQLEPRSSLSLPPQVPRDGSVDSRLGLGWPRWLPAEHSARHSPRNNLTSTTERATRSSWIWRRSMTCSFSRSRSMCGEGRLSPSPPIVLHALNRRDAPAVQFRPGVCSVLLGSMPQVCALPSRPSWRAGRRTGGLLAGDVRLGPCYRPVLVSNSDQEELVAGSGGPLLTWPQASVGPYKTRRRV